MSHNQNFSRRDFLKLGSLAAISLPAINRVGQLGEFNLYQSDEEYGGFLIRKHTKDDPPYEVDDSIYQRFDARNTAFGRLTWDEEAGSMLADATVSAMDWIAKGEPGFRKEDFALHNAAWTVGNGTGSNPGLPGLHAGLLQLEPFYPNESAELYELPWDRSHLTDEDVTQMVKKASKFYGASLVGITDLDERWLYSKAFDFSGANPPIEITEVEEVKLPEGQVSPQQAKETVQASLKAMTGEELKEFIITTLEKAPPGAVPTDGPPPGMLKAMPAKQFPGMLPRMFGSMPLSMVKLFSDALEFDYVIANVDPGESSRPRYLDDLTLAIPETMNRVIVLAFEMDYDAVMTYPTQTGTAAAANGYSRMVFTSSCLAEFIRTLGFNAIPCANNTGLSVPMAIDAGLGELGRQGVLITPKYGPRVRLAKVITDMPLLTDQPISFGVTEFCDVCGKCAIECPGQAISYEPRSFEARTVSNNAGVKKWPIDPMKCFATWQSLGGGDCGTCIRACPFNKVDNWLHEATRILIGAKSGSLDKLLLNLDDTSGYGKQEDPVKFFGKENYIHIKGGY